MSYPEIEKFKQTISDRNNVSLSSLKKNLELNKDIDVPDLRIRIKNMLDVVNTEIKTRKHKKSWFNN
jgi:hypothetical protein|tara:strand:- start:1803 stop:2003 length:201 start_codon:yes stop_codon:yes gene_type:complete